MQGSSRRSGARNKPRPGRDEAPSRVGNRLYYISVSAALVLVIGIVIYLKLREDPIVREVRKFIQTSVKIAEKKDIPAGLALIDESYTDNFGNNYARIRTMAERDAGDVSDISIKLRNLDIKPAPNGRQAQVRFEMLVRAKIDDGMGHKIPVCGIRERQNPLTPNWDAVSLQLVRHEAGWRVARAEISVAAHK